MLCSRLCAPSRALSFTRGGGLMGPWASICQTNTSRTLIRFNNNTGDHLPNLLCTTTRHFSQKRASKLTDQKSHKEEKAKAQDQPQQQEEEKIKTKKKAGKGKAAAKEEHLIAKEGQTKKELQVIAVRLPLPSELKGEGLQKYFKKCEQKLGFVPNVLRAYSHNETRLSNFVNMYNELMLSDQSKLSKLEREMIAVGVSSANRCFYCLVAHGAAVRMLSGDPKLGEMVAFNYRVADLSVRHKTMLDFVWKLTVAPWEITEVDRERLRQEGKFSEEEIWDIAEVAGFFNMSNRVASATEMMPNEQYHTQARSSSSS